MAVWFAGTRKGSQMSRFRSARFDAETGQVEALSACWQPVKAPSRPFGKRIRKLGNPVISLGPDNRLWLFYVSVSIGGWAGVAVNAMSRYDWVKPWSTPAAVGSTSLFLNIAPWCVECAGFTPTGSIGLAGLHEFLGKFPRVTCT